MSHEDTTIVLATSNAGKLAEFRALFAGLPIELVAPHEVLDEVPVVPEDGDTFEANAIKKARAVADAAMMITLADDSGLEVDVLNGAPGVRSARFAGERATDAENNAALLQALKDVPQDERTARFRCVLCLIDPWSGDEQTMVMVEGSCEGAIARSPRGSGGFGYDPLFVLTKEDRTMAELSDGEKNAISHRARAASALRPKLVDMLDERAATTERISMMGGTAEDAG
jgi:XTP/dITP diphosphohydrolase